MIAGEAKERLGYTTSTQRKSTPDTMHRVQTRYHFLYLYFRFSREVLTTISIRSEVKNEEIYFMLHAIKADFEKNPREQHPFLQLLTLTDEAIYTYMRLAAQQEWYTDRNSFLHREDSINEGRIIQGTVGAEMKIRQLAPQVQAIINSRTE